MRPGGSIAALILLFLGVTPAMAQAGPDLLGAAVVQAAAATGDAATVTGDAAPGDGSAADRLHAGMASSLAVFPPPERLGASTELQPATAVPASIAMQQDRRGGVTWLVVGASLLGAGMLIDDNAGTALSVGGAFVAAYGVYLMVRR
jgi:hypothetical protein